MFRSIKGFAISLALSLNLYSNTSLTNPIQNINYQTYVKNRNITDNNIKIEMLCDIIHLINQKTCEEIISSNNIPTKQEKQVYRKFLQILTQVIEVSKKQTNEYDKKVYYSTIALKSLFESFMNDKYMELTGGFKTLVDFDCVEYGKQVEKIESMFNV